ncbi:MAG: GFA family protein [Pseudomonadota bacterium]
MTDVAVASEAHHGRCYCGAVSVRASGPPVSVSYCHCVSCRRATGAPVTALAGFPTDRVQLSGAPASAAGTPEGVKRTFCGVCGTAISFEGDYVPNQTFLHVGLFDTADDGLAPQWHSHDDERISWVSIVDDCIRYRASSRDALNASAAQAAANGG